MANLDPMRYNNPNDQLSSIDVDNKSSQFNTFYWLKKALIDARKEQYFMPLASTIGMPKHYGKTIKRYQYVPLLDDRNVNDQGIDATGAKIDGSGNLYGSSKDIGTITSKLPTLSENGGRVNRVGFSRLTREASIQKFGFFYEWTQEAMDFDTDSELMSHLSRELMNGAVQLSEAMLQKDLLAGAGVEVFPGAATSRKEVSGEKHNSQEGTEDVLNYDIFMRLDQILTDNRCPKQTTIINGSLMTDTRVLPACRVMFVGSEVVPLLRKMRNSFGDKAFIDVQHYANAGKPLKGEIGSIDSFRIVQVPEMLHWDGEGATVTKNPGYRTSTAKGGEKYNVYPLLVVGEDSFNTIGFETDGKSVKFKTITKKPGQTNADRSDPYGETGFSSIKWYYGTLINRPERIGVIYTVAPK